MRPSEVAAAMASAGGSPPKTPHRQQQQHVEVMQENEDYQVLVDARVEAGRRPSVEVILRPDPSTSLRGEMLLEQEDVECTPTHSGLVKCLQTDFDDAAAFGIPAIESARPIDGTVGGVNQKGDSLIDRTIDLQRHMSRVRSEISFDHSIMLAEQRQHRHQRGWLFPSSQQEQGTFDSEDNSFLFNSPRGVTKLAPFFQTRSPTPNHLSNSTGMSCGVLSTAFKSSPMVCTNAKAVARSKYASAADTHAKSVSSASQERTADLSDSQMTSELRLACIAGLDSSARKQS